jgi:hypothetical protein
MNSYQLDCSYNDSETWRWDFLGMEDWKDEELTKYTKNYAYYSVRVIGELHRKFNIPDLWSISDEEESEEWEDSNDDEYYDEAWANYGQFKDLY